MRQKSSGFSLIELLVVISIVGILTSLALPSYHRFMAQREAEQVLTFLERSIRKAKYDAVLYHQNVVFCASENLQSCHLSWDDGFIVFTDNNRNLNREEKENLLVQHQFNLKYGSLNWRGFTARKLIFEASIGLPIRSNGRFTYCSHYGFHEQLILNRIGLARREKIDSC